MGSAPVPRCEMGKQGWMDGGNGATPSPTSWLCPGRDRGFASLGSSQGKGSLLQKDPPAWEPGVWGLSLRAFLSPRGPRRWKEAASPCHHRGFSMLSQGENKPSSITHHP